MIPGQFPVQLAIKPGLLQTLALKPGQLFDAVVIGPGKPGLTEVLVGKQQMSLALLTPPGAGTTLRMRVDLTSVGPRFVVVAQTPPPAAGATPMTVPATAEQPQAQMAQTGAKALPVQPNPASEQTPSSPQPQNSATIIERAQPEIARPGAAPSQALKPGQVVEVRVLGTNQAGKTEVSFGKQQMSLPLPGNPPAGTTLQLRVEATPVGPRFVVVAQTPPQAAGASASIPTPVAQTQVPSPNTSGQALPQTPAPTAQQAPTVQNGQNLPAQDLRTGPTPAPAVAQGSAVPTPAAAGAAEPAVAAPPMPQTELGALNQMVQTAVGRQDTSSALMGALATLAKARTPLPAPVVKAMAQVLATRTDLSTGEISGKALQQAVARSGVFQEALLARGDPAAAGDVKTALLGLRGALVSWLGSEGAAVFGQVQRQPPMRGGVPRAQRESRDPLLLDGGPDEIGKAVLERTDSALSRLRLHQNASLPDPVHKAHAEWNMELPVNLGLQQSVLQMQISRDGGGGNGQAAERNWQMRFAIDLQSIGEVGAQVGLRGRKASVMLWAAEPDTADALREMLPGLYAELGAVGLEAGAITVRASVPAAPAQASGGFVDAMR